MGRPVLFSLTMLLIWGTWAYGADCNNGGRYEDNANGTVIDCRTGLVWLKNAQCTDVINGVSFTSGKLTWFDAMKWAAGLKEGDPATSCGLTDGSSEGDWRLPTKTEWMNMIEYAKRFYSNPVLTNGSGATHWTSGDVFTNVQSGYYWSSTSCGPFYEECAWATHMGVGAMGLGDKTATPSYVWPVRAGQAGSFGSLRIE